MSDRLHLLPRHRRAIEALLRDHLPGVEVWAYGSRVNGRSHDASDLDLVLRGPSLGEIPVGRLVDLTVALRESTIPILVEARDWARLPTSFHREIERDYVVMVEGWSEYPDDVELGGFVRMPRRGEAERDGTITLLTSIDGRNQSVTTVLKQSDYERAVSAHKEQASVVVKGDLERVRQRWSLLNPMILDVIRNDDAPGDSGS